MNQTPEEIVAEIKVAMDEYSKSMTPILDDIESKILNGMADFGGSARDVEKTKKWLRPLMETQMRQFVLEKFFNQTLDKTKVK